MKILAVETSTLLGGVAVMDGDALVAESRINMKATHSERLLQEIEHLLVRCGLSAADIDVFGMAIGPGSFTGLRVGLSTVKGLVYAADKRLVTVSTLEAFAWNTPFSLYPVCTLLDARKKEVYAAIFRWDRGRFVRVLEEQSINVDALIAQILCTTLFLGEGALRYREQIESRLGERALYGPPQAMIPSASHVAYLCLKKAEAGIFEDPVSLVPRYFRKAEAEMMSGEKRRR